MYNKNKKLCIFGYTWKLAILFKKFHLCSYLLKIQKTFDTSQSLGTSANMAENQQYKNREVFKDS